MRIARLPAPPAPPAARSARAEVGPLTEIRLAENDCAGRAQFRGNACIAPRAVFHERERPRRYGGNYRNPIANYVSIKSDSSPEQLQTGDQYYQPVIPANLTEHRAIEFTASQLAEAVTTCFEGYIMPFNIDGPGFERRFRPEGLDAQSSVVLMAEDQPAAVCLIARQGWTSRVAAMAIADAFTSSSMSR